MNAIRIRRQLDSETLELPELRPLIGKSVEIIVLDDSESLPSAEKDWSLLEKCARELTDYDFGAIEAQNEVDLKWAQEHAS